MVKQCDKTGAAGVVPQVCVSTGAHRVEAMMA